VINASTGLTTATIAVAGHPDSAAVTPDGARLYVSSQSGNTVSVIDTATNMVIAVIPVGTAPI
jgi:YVTN family beta-propeller protein